MNLAPPFPITYLHSSLPFQFHNSPKKESQEWNQKYGPSFANLQTCFTPSQTKLNKSATAHETSSATVIKTQEVACQNLPIVQPIEQPIKAQRIDFDEVLPFDPQVTLKKLDNGFTYYLRNNAYPSKETASLRLVIRAGSTDEKDDEQGLAHFLEHLLFYETENFGKADIKHLLESKGATFGADQNAHTSFNETVYKFDIPLNDPELLDKALQILREMITKAKISDSSVNEERTVVLDEIVDEEASERYMKKRNAVLFEGTPYPNRSPAGLANVIKECTAEQIRAFYRRTYQPQNMALVAVGDFDCKKIEELIIKHFGDIPSSADLQLKHEFQPVEREEAQFVCHADPESTASILQLHFPLSNTIEIQEATIEGIRQGIINSFYQMMFNKRLQELVTDSDNPPFVYANGSKTELMDNLIYYRLTLMANDGEIPSAYKRLLLEIKRVQEHGFLPEEFEMAKKTYLAQLEHLENEKNNISNQELAESYVSHFADGSPSVNVSKILDLKKKLVDFVKLTHVNIWNKILTSNTGTIVSTLVPSSIANTVSPEILKKMQDEAAVETVTPYENTFIDRPLLRGIPQPGKIVETSVFEKVGVTQWTLENGMRVYVRPSTNMEDSILMYASSIGGELTVPFEKRAAADMAVEVFSGSGRAGLTPSQLKKVLNGKTVGQQVLIGNYTTSLLTSSTKKDLDTAFQLLNTAYLDRTFRNEAFNTAKKENLNAVKHRDNNPDSLFYQTETALCTQNHPRFQPISAEEFEKVEYQDIVDFVNGQFHNPGNFDLVITGNVDLNETKELVEKYLAGIQGGREKISFDTFNYPAYEYPAGIVAKEIEIGIASDCKTHISFPAPAQDTRESRQLGVWTAELLKTHLYDLLTLDQGKTYGISCQYALTTLPGQEKTDPSSMELEFSGLPESIKELNEKVLKEIKRIQVEGFTIEEIASFKAQIKERHRKSLDRDGIWMSMIASNARWKWDLNSIIEDFTQSLENFDEKIAQEQLQKLFPLDRYVEVTLFPKNLS